jgi:hypothetical protein
MTTKLARNNLIALGANNIGNMSYAGASLIPV